MKAMPHIENIESDIHSEFEGFSGAVFQSCADIYISDKPFGYYYSVWPATECKKIDLVVFAIDEKSLETKIGIGASYIKQTKTIDYSLSGFLYDAEWLAFNGVIKPAEIDSYTTARKLLEMIPIILTQDMNIQHEISANKSNPPDATKSRR